jgi:hypothetical protein
MHPHGYGSWERQYLFFCWLRLPVDVATGEPKPVVKKDSYKYF